MTDFPTLIYTSIREISRSPFIYLKPEKGTPLGRGFHIRILVIIWSTHHSFPRVLSGTFKNTLKERETDVTAKRYTGCNEVDFVCRCIIVD